MASKKASPSPIPSVSFRTTLSAFGNNTGIGVPQSLIEQLGAGYHTDTIHGAKTDETRQRRIEKSVALFVEGKQR